jgi:hypothetical protein
LSADIFRARSALVTRTPANRGRDDARAQIVVHRDGHAEFLIGIVVEHRALALGHGELAERLGVQVVLRHIAVHQQAEPAGRALDAGRIPERHPEPAIGRAPRRRRRIGAQHHGHLAHAGLDRHGGTRDAGQRRAAAVIGDLHPARRDAQIVAQIGGVVLVGRFRMRHVGRESVDIGGRETGLCQNLLEHAGGEFVRRLARPALDRGLTVSGDHHVAGAEMILRR